MENVAYYGLIAGAIAAVLQEAGQRFGLIRQWKRTIALGLAVAAGGVAAILSGSTDGQDPLVAMGAALAASQAIWALVLAKLGTEGG